MPPLGRLHVIVNPSPTDDGLDLAKSVLDAGAPLLQVRVKDVDDRERLRLTDAVTGLCRAYGATSIVNDRADLALACHADGVHGGETDLPVQALRTVVGPDKLVGGTARDPFTARALEEQGADYIGVGPVFATRSKTSLPAPLGSGVLHEVVLAVDIPVIAISGITPERVGEVMSVGAHGVAVIGAIADADDPGRATVELLAALEEWP
ncbi:MAG: thiamine phosphate synthase [Actinobacteria bacterium]|nr:MAG: thiamine phosphate synthase [Actinomycetota bacterium]RIK03879.1 MAG: thiamine phosphate synthase [Acidobacteriota bacterium]